MNLYTSGGLISGYRCNGKRKYVACMELTRDRSSKNRQSEHEDVV
jgi:hypothetical protein